MDQIKIGRFIAEKRKEKKLTQAKLGEMLSVSDRAVSKWERGLSMPDVSIMLSLCEILEVTVNDLLSGEVIEMKDYTGPQSFCYIENSDYLMKLLLI